jgi:hypothetical protein
MIVQFKGETREEAIINHFSLDMEEEDLFMQYISEMGYTINDSDEVIESLHEMFRKRNYPNP